MERLTTRVGYQNNRPIYKTNIDMRKLGSVDKLKSALGTYEDAEEEGLLKILPVTIGADVYFIPSKVNYDLNVLNGYEKHNRVYHQKVKKIVFHQKGWYLELDKNLEYGVDRVLVDTFFNETWFTDEDTANAALKAMTERG